MNVPRPFDLASAPFGRGATLLAASAGTGKTYAIAGLFLRLLIEGDGVEVSRILVTTYTEAATAELRDRIRKLLRNAAEAFRCDKSDDPFLQALLRKHESARATARLDDALRSFDEAAIHTMHSFCQRVLREAAFESGLPFDAELIQDQNALFAEIADDYWRAQFYSDTPCLTSLALNAKLYPSTFAALLRETSSHPDLAILPATDEVRLESLKGEICAVFKELRECWETDGDSIRDLLLGRRWAKATHAVNYQGALPQNIKQFEACFAPGAAPETLAVIASFAAAALRKATLKDATTPEHCCFELCEKFGELAERYVQAVRAWFIAWARQELARRKSERNVLSFDDLLTRLRDALRSSRGPALIRQLRGRFDAALIDEYQDTDPVQNEIFECLFGEENTALYLIGDPKQAIYGFRGADVFTYLRSVNGVAADQRWTLHTNYRAERALVAGVNRIFNRAPGAFVIPEIEFDNVDAAGRADAEPLTIGGRRAAPLQLWKWSSAEPLQIGDANRELPPVCAGAIARLLAADARIGSRGVRASDVAVLVATHHQGQLVQDALRAFAIPSVLLSRQSVLRSHEAGELQIVLAAIAQPGREALLRAALGTDLFAVSAIELERLAKDERRLEGWMERFQSYHQQWVSEGFIPLFRRLLRCEEIRPRLLALPDGERRLTNLLHLSELLHETACAQRLSALALLKWLGEQLAPGTMAVEEAELRLERDDDAVQIVTMHRSKGLEYPIVFCPFTHGPRRRSRPKEPAARKTIFHDPAADFQMTIDLESGPESEAQSAQEQLAEQVRLFYVALTRAQHACHFVWGRFKGCEASAGAWLFHRPPGGEREAAAALQTHMSALTPEAFEQDLRALSEAHSDAIELLDLPAPDGPRYIPSAAAEPLVGPRTFHGSIRRDWRISSFTSLTEHRDAERPDHDPAPVVPVETGIVASGIHALPPGVRAGNCLHEIFEELDFGAANEIAPLVERKLRGFNFEPKIWAEPVTTCVTKTLQLELAPGLRLASVAKRQRLTELEFHLPAAALTAQALRAALPAEAGSTLVFEPRRGLLKGFIDLVFEHSGRFYIVDWKSNWLGPSAASYTADAIEGAMLRHRYALQYHLYTLALHRYLATRQRGYSYAEHFGGVFYLFVRGAEAGVAVHRARPEQALIEELDASFATRP